MPATMKIAAVYEEVISVADRTKMLAWAQTGVHCGQTFLDGGFSM